MQCSEAILDSQLAKMLLMHMFISLMATTEFTMRHQVLLKSTVQKSSEKETRNQTKKNILQACFKMKLYFSLKISEQFDVRIRPRSAVPKSLFVP